MNSQYLTVDQTAKVLNKTQPAIFKMIKRGRIKQVVRLDKTESISQGLPWRSGGGGGHRGKRPYISITDPMIPQAVRFKYYEAKIAAENNIEQRKNSILAISNIQDYSAHSKRNRETINNRSTVLRLTADKKGESLKQFIQIHNQQNPENQLQAYETILLYRRTEKEYGPSGLADAYGKNLGRSCVPSELLQFFKKPFLKEGAPSSNSCWLLTLGYAKEIGLYDLINFPSARSFERAVIAEIGKEAVYLARHGKQKWNRKYAGYISRNYDGVRAGQGYVADHHQVDALLKLPNGKYIRPWITVWRDFKSGKWLSWLLHVEPPNADHIFQTLYFAILNFGVPAEIVIDNGKDFRCHDLRGNKTTHRVTVDEIKMSGLFATLGIIVHYCLPYRAQSKPIERDFRTVKEGFCKFQLLYTGGNPQEKPESNKPDMKAGKGDSLEDVNGLLNTYIKDIFNEMPSKYSKNLSGGSRNELFEKDRLTPRFVKADSLMLLCTRTSKPLTIGRNGVRDSALKIDYWGEFMTGHKGEKVYLRRDSNHYEEAWCFDLADKFVGKAEDPSSVSALVKTPVEKAQLSAAMKAQRARAKAVKKLAEVTDRPSPAETIKYMAAGVAVLNEQRGYQPTGKEVEGITMITTADGVIKQAAEMEARGTCSLAGLLPPKPEKKDKILLWKYEKTEAEENRKREGKSHG